MGLTCLHSMLASTAHSPPSQAASIFLEVVSGQVVETATDHTEQRARAASPVGRAPKRRSRARPRGRRPGRAARVLWTSRPSTWGGKHLRTTNPIESTFGPGPGADRPNNRARVAEAGLAMVSSWSRPRRGGSERSTGWLSYRMLEACAPHSPLSLE